MNNNTFLLIADDTIHAVECNFDKLYDVGYGKIDKVRKISAQYHENVPRILSSKFFNFGCVKFKRFIITFGGDVKSKNTNKIFIYDTQYSTGVKKIDGLSNK